VRTACVLGFVAKSAEKKLPVLIAESFPRFVGTAGGAASWGGWFAPFFGTLLRQPAVKGWSYIDRGARSSHGLVVWAVSADHPDSSWRLFAAASDSRLCAGADCTPGSTTRSTCVGGLWGEARIEAPGAGYVGERYKEAVRSDAFVHAATLAKTCKALGVACA